MLPGNLTINGALIPPSLVNPLNIMPHTVIVDNAGGHLMQRGEVDLCITGTDRTTRAGDVCNKIGTYLKALAAKDNGVAFYVALPGPTIDWSLSDGADIPLISARPNGCPESTQSLRSPASY